VLITYEKSIPHVKIGCSTVPDDYSKTVNKIPISGLNL
jgi:hypothetical protein